MQLPLRLFFSCCWRNCLCPLGIHGPKFTGTGDPANYCHYGCGHQFRPDSEIYSTYRVTLVTGEDITVEAVNEHHARSLVAFGAQCNSVRVVNAVTRVLGEEKVHPNNIKKVVRVDS